MYKLRLVLLSAFLMGVVGMLTAQEEKAPPVTLESPQNTLHVHLYYLQTDSYRPEMAARTIPPNTDSAHAVNLAIKIKQIYDGMGLYVYLNQVPDRANYRDTITNDFQYTPFPNQLPGISLERQNGNWYYAESSLRNVDDLHAEVYPFGSDFLMNLMPDRAREKFLGLAVWQYLGILFILIVAVILYFFFRELLNPLITGLTINRLQIENVEPTLVRNIASILSLIILIWIIKMLVPILKLPVKGAEWTMTGLRIIMTVFIAVLLFRMANVLKHYFQNLAGRTESKMDDQVLPLLEKTLKIIIVIAAIVHILTLLHVNLTAIIAGISIAGLALALATQDSVKNLIGSIMIFLDKPFQIDDFIEVDGKYGTVEEVGFRSTRIRTIDTSLISIPNGILANMMVRNMGIRFFRLFDTTLSITYHTPPGLVEQLCNQIEQVILMHPMAADENYIVRFSEFGESSLEIKIRVYFRTNDYLEELKIREEFLLAIMRLAQTLGVHFAFPSQTLYVEDFPEKQGKQPSHDTSEETIENRSKEYLQELRNQLANDYPDEDTDGGGEQIDN